MIQSRRQEKRLPFYILQSNILSRTFTEITEVFHSLRRLNEGSSHLVFIRVSTIMWTKR